MKKVGIGIATFLVGLLLLGFIVPKDCTVEVEKEIKGPTNYVYNIVNDVTSISQWHSWIKDNPNVNIKYGDRQMGEGASFSWMTDEGSESKVLYQKVIKNERIEGNVQFDGDESHPFAITFTPKGDYTLMKWKMETELRFPFNLFKMIYRFKVKRSYKKSMAAIEELIVPRMKGIYEGFEVNEVPYNERHFIMNRDEVAYDNIQKFFSLNQGPIYERISQENMVITGMPCSLFFKKNMTKGVMDMAVAIPVLERKDIAGLSSYTIPAGPAAVIDYYGDYSATAKAHRAMEQYLRDRDLQSNAPHVEEYVTNPLEEKDIEKWLTKIIYYYTPLD